ncbi:hypothetical protein BOTBODRAFT_163394 [Botryobasidium botryosum FD-172 SS1]|uniref:Smr domain-containing protein n=1 Tax=Botryobasidium botryosum (strain FD-172 SS1) TaxID=930990 RepID=A0A067M556_BOTB1|nr:hypothetical protein BOTBODRAFT_163394 [Botryobasidium botryosum FD-172 SS1]
MTAVGVALLSVISACAYFLLKPSAPPEEPFELEPGRAWRRLAREQAELRQQSLEASQAAYTAGRRSEAKRLSERGKEHSRNMVEYNIKAASEIFDAKNPGYSPTALAEIDLHGLHTNEALEYATTHLELCRKKRVSATQIITGRGNRSTSGAKLKPAIEGLLIRTSGIAWNTDSRNEGRLLVIFNPEEEPGWGCTVM